jgi:hypothetical protein
MVNFETISIVILNEEISKIQYSDNKFKHLLNIINTINLIFSFLDYAAHFYSFNSIQFIYSIQLL